MVPIEQVEKVLFLLLDTKYRKCTMGLAGSLVGDNELLEGL